MKRFEELDALRGIAAVWVMLFHYLLRYDQLYRTPPRFPFVFPNGELGVFLFFIISGFVIMMTLQASNNRWDFVTSRFSRLYPAFWVSVLLTFTIGVLAPLPNQNYTVSQLLFNLTMLQGYLYVPDIDGVYWSLTYELGFYAVMYVLFLCRLLDRVVLIGAVWLAVALVQAISIMLWDQGIPYRPSVVLVLRFAHLFVAGLVLHEVWRGRGSAGHYTLLAVAGALAFLHHPIAHALCVSGCIGVFLLAIAGHMSWLRLRWLAWLGSISYPLYLTHEFLGFRLIYSLEGAGAPPIASVAITIACALLLADTISRFVERPAMAAIRGAYRRRTAQRAV